MIITDCVAWISLGTLLLFWVKGMLLFEFLVCNIDKEITLLCVCVCVCVYNISVNLFKSLYFTL